MTLGEHDSAPNSVCCTFHPFTYCHIRHGCVQHTAFVIRNLEAHPKTLTKPIPISQ